MRSQTFTTSDARADHWGLTYHVLRITSRVAANAWLSAALIFVLTRALALVGAYGGVSTLIAAEPARNKGWWVELGLMWDSAWYAGIARDHYTFDPTLNGGSSVAFAPLYPFLMRALGSVLQWVTFGWDWGNAEYGALITAGLLISNITFYLALVLLIRLLAPRLGASGANIVALALASLPIAFFFSALYTEGLFLFLTLAAFSIARSDWRLKWLCAGLVGMLASLDRFAGLLLLPVLAIEYLSQKGWSLRRIRLDALWVVLVPLGTAIYMGFLWWRFGSPLVLTQSMEAGWDHRRSFFLTTYWDSLSQLWMSLTGGFPPEQDPVLYYGGGNRLYLILDIGLPTLLLIGGWLARKKLLASEWTWLVLGILYPLSTNITFSMARYVLPLWPGLVWIGMLRRGGRAVALICILLSMALMVWCSSIYGGARWIG